MYNFGHFGTKQAGELLGSIGSLFTTSELCLGLAVNQQSIGSQQTKPTIPSITFIGPMFNPQTWDSCCFLKYSP